MKIFSKIISVIAFPLFIPIYAIIMLSCTDFFSLYPASLMMKAYIDVALCGTLIPLCVILLLKKLNLISSMGLENRKDRFFPFFMTAVLYCYCAFALYKNAFPAFVFGICFMASISLFINTIVTQYWQISAHLTGVGGLLGGTLVTCFSLRIFPFYVIATLVLLCGLVAMSRLYLKAHTPMQVVAGFANGFLLTTFSSFLNWTSITNYVMSLFE